MEKAIGYINYDVRANCPHCKGTIFLTRPPYTGGGEYEDGENKLNTCVFGFIDEPANWKNPDIEFECCYCEETFILERLAM